MFRDAYSRDYQLKQAYEGRLFCDPRPRARHFERVQCLLCFSAVMMAQQLSWASLLSKTPGLVPVLWNTDMLHCIQPPPSALPHNFARPVASSPACFPPHPTVHSAGCCHQQLCFLPKHKVSRRHWSYREGGWQGKSYRTAPWDVAPGHTRELPEWAWLCPLPCLAVIHSESFSLVSTWRRQHRSPTASEKADGKCLHFTEEKTKA